MPRPTKIAERYKRALGALLGHSLADSAVAAELIGEVQGLCEALDQTAERLYRLERMMLAWSGSSRLEFEKSRSLAMLPEDGSAFARIVHQAMQDDED